MKLFLVCLVFITVAVVAPSKGIKIPPCPTEKTTPPPPTECCGPFEEYLECGPNCETTCATLGQKCTVVYIKCPSGCYCIEGFARNHLSQCIPVQYCFNPCFNKWW